MMAVDHASSSSAFEGARATCTHSPYTYVVVNSIADGVGNMSLNVPSNNQKETEWNVETYHVHTTTV